MLTQADGERIKAQLARGVSATLRIDDSHRAGASSSGFARLFTPDPFAPGDSINHFDPIAAAHLLMKPITAKGSA
jgi:hypothetical protein